MPDGSITLDYDQPLSTKDIGALFYDLFGDNSVGKDKEHILYGKLGLLVADVTYLGHPWPLFKKRIQLKDYYPEVFFKNQNSGLDTLFVGVYHYQSMYLFVVFDPGPYVEKKSHNSSAHVQSFDLQYAAKAGTYSKTDAMGHFIRIMDLDHFVQFVKDRVNAPTNVYDYDEVMRLIRDYFEDFFKGLPKGVWNGIDCYNEMKSGNADNWRQGEWQGWYFEYLFKKYLEKHPNDQISYYGDKSEKGIDFDIVFSKDKWIYGDLKADKCDGDILGNKFQSFDIVLKDHNGRVLYVVLRYKAELDKKHGYKTTIFWNQFRDDDKKYATLDEIKDGYGIRMKYSITPQEIKVISIDKTAYEILKKDPFHQGRNSDGKERETKLKVGKDMIEALSVYSQSL